ncbi:MAG: hypothetical protein ACYTJ0_11025 [Planctomycetota bacterium]
MPSSVRQRDASPWVESGLIVGFLGLAAWFIWGSGPVEIPAAASPPVARRAVATEPVRGDVPLEPLIEMGSFTRRCSECHRLFESAEETARRLTEHQHIVLDHGLNDLCFNCHDRQDRDRLALRGGETVSFAEVPRLCAKCHGPTYRDWQRGMHGRTVGSWDPKSPEHVRLVCSQCHDPHAPAYDPMRPLPGPHTLRMGHPHDEPESEPVDLIDPLRRWRHQDLADGHDGRPARDHVDAAGTEADESPEDSGGTG